MESSDTPSFRNDYGVPSNDSALYSPVDTTTPNDGTTTATNKPTSSVSGSVSDSCDESLDEEVILSVYWKRSLLGAAMYNTSNPVIRVLNDTADDRARAFEVTTMLLMQIQPTQVITCEAMPQVFLAALNDSIRSNNDNAATSRVRLHLVPNAEYRDENGLRRVLALRLVSKPKDWTDESHIRYLRSVLDFNSRSMIQSLGGLLKFLDKDVSCSINISQSPIMALETLSLENLVLMDQHTFRSLGIFPKKKPSFPKRGDNREEPSLFGTFNRCRTNIGSQFMKSTFLKPTKDVELITERQEVIAFCTDIRNDEVVRGLWNTIAHVCAVAPLLPKLRGLQANTTMWKRLFTTLQNILLIAEICGCFGTNIKFFTKVRNAVTSDLTKVARIIEKIVDFDDPEGGRKFVVRPGFDDGLDRLKALHAKLPVLLNKLAELEIQDLPEYVTECICVYYPEIGFLLTVQEWKRDLTEQELHIPGYVLMFRSGDLIRYKSRRCQELDETLGDPVVLIAEVQVTVMMRLVDYVQEHFEEILYAVNLVAELDCLISMSMVAKENNFVRPKMTKDHRINVVQGRHSLEGHWTTAFVPNDIKSGGDYGLVKIITGPNNSGKTVYLKQVGLLVYLAHLGSFVPAQKATIEVMDRICTRIRTGDSIGSGVSTFMADVAQISSAVNPDSPASLVILDEFGKGTIDVNGRALLAACLKHFLKRGRAGCPHVLTSTHFHGLEKMLPESPLIYEQRMDQLISAEGETTNLYRLVDGRATMSSALQVALTVGIPESIVNRARELAAGGAEPVSLETSCQREKRDLFMATVFTSLESHEDFDDLPNRLRTAKLI